MDGQYYNLWSTDNARIDANDDVVIKSVYDPSPVGYSLPASNAFTGFTNTGQASGNPNEFNIQGSFHKGWYFYCKPNKQGETVFFPTCGSRDYNTGSLYDVATYGFYWVAGPYDTSSGRDLFFLSNYVYPLFGNTLGHGFSVRSAEERETHKFNTKWEMDGKYYNLWSTDNDRTDANDEVVIKSVYDPSPVGYSLPASNAFTGFTTTGGFSGVNATPDLLNVKGDYDEGYYCYTKPGKTGNTFFFYADGLRMHSQGNMRLIPSNGFEWTSGVLDSNTGRNFYFHIKMINPLKDYNKNFGFPVRSAEEKKWRYELEDVTNGVWY